ncbi:hypothetical protein [Chamaesiphon minutus]|uniref:Uncharacterized protein n=1 Tax=Chamaesiphon minutus (strain ATCC 27169 / PCC 6605) TaxID=1173020 RepID=K9UF06_CHAP6|nr:hypothetical protein [Chamaesiphon minutus]AFY93400.1 hypothetical protein Cha6605_2324 [Chamaesiphon minutus PCC 6605]
MRVTPTEWLCLRQATLRERFANANANVGSPDGLAHQRRSSLREGSANDLEVVCVSGSQPGGFLPDYADALRSGFPTMEAHQAARQDKTAPPRPPVEGQDAAPQTPLHKGRSRSVSVRRICTKCSAFTPSWGLVGGYEIGAIAISRINVEIFTPPNLPL